MAVGVTPNIISFEPRPERAAQCATVICVEIHGGVLVSDGVQEFFRCGHL
jgi:hypothetical protein